MEELVTLRCSVPYLPGLLAKHGEKGLSPAERKKEICHVFCKRDGRRSSRIMNIGNLSFYSIFQDGQLEPLTRTTKLDNRLPRYFGGTMHTPKCFQNRGMD